MKSVFKIAGVVLAVWMLVPLVSAQNPRQSANRGYILKGPDMNQIDMVGQHTLLVCASNLEYYLASESSWGGDVGPKNAWQHSIQKEKVCKALALINADIYGLVEIEQGKVALKEICAELNRRLPGRHYGFVDNKTSSAGTYTMAAYVFDSAKVVPNGPYKWSNTGVAYRKYIQSFTENSSGERFLFSINHFKAKTGGGDTEKTRVAEANAVNDLIKNYTAQSYGDPDVLIMGDLNAYYDEQPVVILLNNDGKDKRTDLHRYFHADSSYSYTYHGVRGYLDHAIVNSTMKHQVTGMQAYHVNSDETDIYAYQSGDTSIFRYSDHDPILVGLRLGSSTAQGLVVYNDLRSNIVIKNGEGGFVRIYDMRSGVLLYERALTADYEEINPAQEILEMRSGCYLIHVFHGGQNHVTKVLRP